MHLSFKCFLSAALLLGSQAVTAQTAYRYHVDLRKVHDDKLTVELQAPKISKSTVVFALPKIIPGTYRVADYGAFISNVKAFTSKGAALKVSKLNVNQWRVDNATQLDHMTYDVEDIFDSKIKHEIYPMAATDINEGQDYVLNLPGFLGYFEGMTKMPYEIKFDKPEGFFASTAWTPSSTNATTDVFKASNLDDVYDQPIMYTAPDTATVQVGNCQVLVSVYAPHHMVHASDIAGWMHNLLDAARQYLGGKLPADRYAFLYYFLGSEAKNSFPQGLGGALEHTTSSFYYLGEAPPEYLQNQIVDISAHEFFHIITPLTIASKEVKEFNFDKPVMSEHLWLYEGVTEYTAHHVQVKYGLNSVEEFLNKLSDKINNSRTRYDDRLPFTVMSKHSADIHADQYDNVYEKGALIGACLDIYLLKLSHGNYGLRNLTYDLGIRYGKYRYFNDSELFDVIGELTYPEIKTFLTTYVGGPNPIPYETYFGYAGVKFDSVQVTRQFSFGNVNLAPGPGGTIIIGSPFNPNDFGKKMGYKEGDIIYAVQGQELTLSNAGQLLATIKGSLKEGEPFNVKVIRKNSGGGMDTLALTAPAQKVESRAYNKLTLMKNISAEQQMVQNKWLHAAGASAAVEASSVTRTVKPADVASIDAIIKATYDVISGPAGPRDWARFQGLFTEHAYMGAMGMTRDGQEKFFELSPVEYQNANSKAFTNSGFYEQELKRKVMQFGNIATVASSYQYRFTPGGKIEQRGINYFTLVYSEGRWWVSNISWQDESTQLKLPADFQ